MLRTGSVLLNSLSLKYLRFSATNRFVKQDLQTLVLIPKREGGGVGGVDVMIRQRQGLLMADQFEAEGDLFRAADTRSIYR